MKNPKWVATVAIAMLMVGGALVAHAQVRDAGSKVRGDFTSFNRSASRQMRNSRAVTQDFRAYAQNARRTNQVVTPAVVRHHADELGHSINMTKTYLAEERKLAAGDKEILANLDAIDKLVEEEVKHHKILVDKSKGESVDAEACLKACDDAEKAIEAAITAHEKLIKDLESKK